MNETVKKQKQLQVNVSPALAEQSQNIFQKLGLITQDALTIFFKAGRCDKGNSI
ncbi:hypothetical protein AB3327_14230 [Lactiplantibacillus pentosus]|uniref:hypothetical protein n=1 Tax=Lactiplantibacillus pentosus TaxID=1589 RepID=UPI0015E61BA2|nr:hypothetical protein [Lactiplantibacillus pentosus]